MIHLEIYINIVIWYFWHIDPPPQLSNLSESFTAAHWTLYKHVSIIVHVVDVCVPYEYVIYTFTGPQSVMDAPPVVPHAAHSEYGVKPPHGHIQNSELSYCYCFHPGDESSLKPHVSECFITVTLTELVLFSFPHQLLFYPQLVIILAKKHKHLCFMLLM